MNLLDVIISVIVIGLITAFFATVPNDTYRNILQSERNIDYTTVMSDVSSEIDEHQFEPPEEWLNESLATIQANYNETHDYDFELRGEVVVINGKEFYKIQIGDRFSEQEYFYGRVEDEVAEEIE